MGRLFLAEVVVKALCSRKYLFGVLKNEQEFNRRAWVRERKREVHSGQMPALDFLRKESQYPFGEMAGWLRGLLFFQRT